MKPRGRKREIQSIETLLRQAMPPRYGVMEKLEHAILEWESVVGPVLGRQSAPVDLVNGELTVTAESPLIGNRLKMMAGNIARTLAERWELEAGKVKVVVGRLPLKATHRNMERNTRPAAVRVSEEETASFESRCLESQPDFPKDAAASLARLRAFFIKRFGDKK